jgi:hypothetical protein
MLANLLLMLRMLSTRATRAARLACDITLALLCLLASGFHTQTSCFALTFEPRYSRNETVDAIKSGKYTNIRLMAGSSGTEPNHPGDGKPPPWDPAGYGGVNGSNAWITSTQAISTGSSSGLQGGTYPLFQIGAACWCV